MGVYYNEIERFPCDVLRARIADGRLAGGMVDERDIKQVDSADLAGYRRWHLFAGIGGFELGLQLAGWPDDCEILTGGFPCQDISAAGKGGGLDGERSGLFWESLRIVHELRPIRLLLENVPPLRTRGYDRVADALGEIGYTLWPLVVGAEAVGAPHKRHRVWVIGILNLAYQSCGRRGTDGSARQQVRHANQQSPGNGMADTNRQQPERWRVFGDVACAEENTRATAEERQRLRDTAGNGGSVCDATGQRLAERQRQPEDAGNEQPAAQRASCDAAANRIWSPGEQWAEWLRTGARSWPAGPASNQHPWEPPRLFEFGLGRDTDGLSKRLVRSARRKNKLAIKAYGNAVVPQVVAAVARAWMATEKRHPPAVPIGE